MNEEIQRRLDERWEAFNVHLNIPTEDIYLFKETFRAAFECGWGECIKFATEELIGKEPHESKP